MVLLQPSSSAVSEATRTDSAELYLGRGIHDRPISVSLLADAPHIALSMTTGMGKSTVCRVIAAQILHYGGRVVIMDSVKAGDSHGSWCRDENSELLPGVELYRTHEQVHAGLVAWAQERHRRSDAAYRRTGETFQRTLIVLEEMNATIGALRNHWAKIKKTGDPIRSPAVDAILDLTCAGRSALIHVLAVAQKLTAAAVGSDAIRENLSIKILGNCSIRTWRMLTEQPYPKRGMSDKAGDVILIVGPKQQELHIAGISDEDTREWATSGAPQPVGAGLRLPSWDLPAEPETEDPNDVSPVEVVRSGHSHAHVCSNDEPDMAAGQDSEPEFELPPEQVTLRQAIDLGLLPGMKLPTVEKARQREGDFPLSVGKDKRGAQLYDWQDLMSWHSNRIERG